MGLGLGLNGQEGVKVRWPSGRRGPTNHCEVVTEHVLEALRVSVGLPHVVRVGLAVARGPGLSDAVRLAVGDVVPGGDGVSVPVPVSLSVRDPDPVARREPVPDTVGVVVAVPEAVREGAS